MATQLQIRRGSDSQVSAFTGAEGEIVVNTTNDSIHVNDGSTAGGFELARVDGSNWNVTNNITTTSNIDVGTVTADGLTVDGDGTLQSNASSSVPTLTLKDTDTSISVGQSLGRLSFSSADNSPDTAGERAFIRGYLIDGTNYGIDIGAMVSGGSPTKRLTVSGSGDISFYEDTGTTPKLFWDASAESLGIGTASPSTYASGLVSYNTPITVVGDQYDGSLFDSVFFGGQAEGLTYRNIIRNSLSATSANQKMQFSVANGASTHADVLTLTGSGNVGIGTSSPTEPLTVSKTASGSTTQIVSLVNPVGAASTGVRLWMSGTNTTTRGTFIDAVAESTSNDHTLRFGTSASSAAPTERMRIDSSGRLLHQTTSSSSYPTASVYAMFGTGGDVTLKLGGYGGSHTMIQFLYAGNNAVGSIVSTASATSYNTSSDQRLKDNIVDAPSASNDIDAIQVRSFDWKADGSHQKYGVVAQELQAVAPEAVSGDADSDEMMGVDYSKLVPMLIKEIQSLRARVNALES